ncbi:MAG TPA: arabinofuranosidase catalytic domain-containing protein [Streptosporangiaceae bacterium]|nr:arabinofuranosidase catalytic domain-containing protein [Streptosporangiaceae bacterium]
MQSPLRSIRQALFLLAGALTLAVGALAAVGASPAAAASLPCDIYASGGTPCVAAHSTTRALYASYNGPLYQVRRSSDNATTNISPLSAGGVANAATQDSFCSGTTCVITEIYDQSGHGNNLTDAPGGGAAGGPDNLANATAAPATVGGHKVYGVYVAAGTGYRDDTTSGIATGDNPEGEYAIFDGTHYNGGCCFDYGNAETNNDDDGNGTMEAIYFGNIKVWGYGTGNGPWIMADMENGLYSGVNAGYNANDPTIANRFTTAMINGGANHWQILGGNAQSGGLSTFYDGTRPNVSGYNPMHKQGAIILGIGGDNSKGAAGTFYEGVMTSGFPSAATENAVQANITSAGYTTSTTGGATGTIVSGLSGSHCVDNNNGSGTNGNKVQIWTCDGYAPAQNWTVNSNGTLTIDGGCMDITNANYSNGTLIEWWTCNGGANQQWQASNGELVNPASGKCLDDPASNTTNGTQLILYTCNGGANQHWTLP